jgi:hypothetical protein
VGIDDTTQPLVLPRGLIFFSSLWLIGSWMITVGVNTPIQPVSASYTPSVRMMLLCMVMGLLIGWPLLRLSQRPTSHPVAQTVLDLVVLIALSQVVLWPLRLVTPWSISRTAAIDATVVSWLVIYAAVLTAAIGSVRPGVRCLAMLACLIMCLAGPALAATGAMGGDTFLELVELSPLMAVHTLGEGAGSHPTIEQWRWIVMLGATAVIAWIALGVGRVVFVRRDSPPVPVSAEMIDTNG